MGAVNKSCSLLTGGRKFHGVIITDARQKCKQNDVSQCNLPILILNSTIA